MKYSALIYNFDEALVDPFGLDEQPCSNSVEDDKACIISLSPGSHVYSNKSQYLAFARHDTTPYACQWR